MSSKQTKLEKSIEKLLNILMFDASGGIVGELSDNEKALRLNTQDISFGDKRALVDTALKFQSMKQKAPKEEVSGFNMMKEMMNGNGRKTASDRNPFLDPLGNPIGSSDEV